MTEKKEMKAHNFEVGGGRKIKNYKSHWPDCLHLKMNRHEAWNIVDGIMQQLRVGQDKIIVSKCGCLEIDIEE